eukprot:scaffold7349_cov173-Amphora_coffeaeformis.AAC.127
MTQEKGNTESEALKNAAGVPNPQAVAAFKDVAAGEPSKPPAKTEAPEGEIVNSQPSVRGDTASSHVKPTTVAAPAAAAASAYGPTPRVGTAAPQQAAVSATPNTNAPKNSAGSGEISSVPENSDSAIPLQQVPVDAAATATMAGSQQANTTVQPATGVPNATKPIAIRPVGTNMPAAALQPAASEFNNPTTTIAQTVPPTKKRKLKPLPVTQLLSDHPVIQKTVHNLLGLLQIYGPLTAGQLEYNLPPISGERVNSQTIHDIVQVLVCTGLVQRVCDPPTTAGQPDKPPGSPRYCVNGGVPRADVVLPHKVLEQISAAHDEIKRCAERRRRLKEALSSKGSPKEMLKEMAIEFPEVLQDPVYLTALRSFHIDITAIERERRVRHQQAMRAAAASRAAAAAAASTAASSTLPLKPSTNSPVVSPPISSKAPVAPNN